MKIRTAETIIWDQKDRNRDRIVGCNICLGKVYQEKCGCFEIEELKGALEVLGRKLKKHTTPFKRCPSKKNSLCFSKRDNISCEMCLIEDAKRQARKNINRRNKK